MSRLPHRWDLVAPDQLGTLLDGLPEPDLWFADELVDCTARVLARCDGGTLYFVGRSLDSMYDLLTAMLPGDGRLRRLPYSRLFSVWTSPAEWRDGARAILAECGLTPYRLARAGEPVALVDVVSTAGTYRALFHLLREWVDEEREPWDVVRRKLRFIGIVSRGYTSPKTVRWQQQANWTARLPAGSIRNVSMDRVLYGYLADRQVKLTDSFGPGYTPPPVLRHDDRTRRALAEAVAVVGLSRGWRRSDRTRGSG
ncbi:hypothetical protein [Actinoplanes sp. G11-F43]|uniref:hypothetical protein n=1 Tax=Actinoplanes sp. G11-F43 TaxID=3424130 RepID=UPI003D33C6CB